MSRTHLRLLFAAFLGVGVVSPAVSSEAAGRVECRAAPSRNLARDVRFCVLLPSSYDSQAKRRYPVLYYLHGLGFNEQALVNTGGWSLVEDLREQGKLGEFVIVAPAGGSSFFINSQDGRQRYEDFFLQEFLPLIERRYRIRADRAHRGITGMSMGGYGALHLAFLHPELFGSVSAHSAALIARLPAGGSAAGRGAMPSIFGRVFGMPFDRAFWEQNDPLRIARDAPGLNRLKIYFDCGDDDDYGFEAGARLLDEELKSRGIPHEFHLYPGGHDALYFATHLPASLEFHSRAFGPGGTGR
jgi:S-formylglutathione hydrolase FrmB